MNLADEQRSVIKVCWLNKILSAITFAPSCVDMGWRWEIYEADNGHLIRTVFRRPDTVSGVVQEGFGRWWHLPSDVTESGVVKTAYAAMRMILEHELMEAFLYEGKKIFNPHHTVEDLQLACRQHNGGFND